MSNSSPAMTVVLPIYNEAHHIQAKLQPLLDFALENPQFEFRFVDDGSSDATATVLEGIFNQGSFQNLSVLRLTQNVGKGKAIQKGFENGSAPLFCFTDGDLAYSPVHILRIYDALQHHDMAIGSRHLAPHISRNSARRKFLGWAFNVLAKLIINVPFEDTQAGIKGMRRELACYIFNKQRLHGFSFDVEMIFLARKQGASIAEIAAEVSSQHDYKKSKVKLLKDSVHMFKEMLSIRLNDWLKRYD